MNSLQTVAICAIVAMTTLQSWILMRVVKRLMGLEISPKGNVETKFNGGRACRVNERDRRVHGRAIEAKRTVPFARRYWHRLTYFVLCQSGRMRRARQGRSRVILAMKWRS